MLYPIQIKNPGNLISKSDFFSLCINNPEINFERNSDKTIVIMAPTSSLTGKYNLKLATQVENWNTQNQDLGFTFDSSTGFTLPNGAVRSPDVAWIQKYRFNALTEEEQENFSGHV